MKVLYFDCSSGISGNMTLGALLEITGEEQFLSDELKKLGIDGYGIEISKKVKNGITGTYVDVILEQEHHHAHGCHEHSHEHQHEHRNLNDVNSIIDNSSLDDKVKELAKKIFMRVARAESKVHNKSLEEVHFHEVGAIDSIIDIVGTSILINKIHPDKIISGIVNDGYGFIECAHGTMSVPVPATSEIFASSNVKFRQIDIDTELVTPTGAAIIAELAENFTTLPVMSVQKIGWGVGSKDLKIPNVLKVYYGEIEEQKEDIVVMETNIDDASGELFGYTQDMLLKNGALDVFFTPIYMKKNRPGYRMSVACRREDLFRLQNIIFRETTTIGIRYRFESRTELERKMIEIDTKYGKIKAKKVRNNGEEYIYPEYESIKELAMKHDIPLKEFYKLEELSEWK
ncbi:MAG: nickel pincer cofactor biosynthesis protein LarC [Lachnospiraceae bacterium]|nr:nickel pincer cofactor biosynthesis protein LarC [Lachnospiraceae bacterium]